MSEREIGFYEFSVSAIITRKQSTTNMAQQQEIDISKMSVNAVTQIWSNMKNIKKEIQEPESKKVIWFIPNSSEIVEIFITK